MKTRISYSELSSLDCWQKHHYRYVERIKPISTFGALTYGRIWDAAQNAYYSPDESICWWLGPHALDQAIPMAAPEIRLERALSAGNDAIDAEAVRVDSLLADRGIPRPDTWDKDIDDMRGMFVQMMFHYHAHWSLSPDVFDIVAVQMPVITSLPSASGKRASTQYEFHGVVDRIIRDRSTGEVYVVDAKTTASLSTDYRLGFDTDWQLPLYVWALRQDGYRIDGAMIDAAAKLTPTYPSLKASPVPVVGEDGEPVFDNLPCDKCSGTGAMNDAYCTGCAGDGIARWASGARAGEPKTRKRTRPALRSMLTSSGSANYSTTYSVMMDAINAHGLDARDYSTELDVLYRQMNGMSDNPFFWREWILFSDDQIEEAVDSIRTVAGFVRKPHAVRMPSAMKCRRCEFRSLCAAPPQDRSSIKDAMFTTPDQREARRPVEESTPF